MDAAALLFDQREREGLLDLEGLVVLLVDLDAAVVAGAKGLSNALLLDGVGTSVLELESTLDIMLEFFEEVVQRFSLSGGIVDLATVDIESGCVLLLGQGELPLVVDLDLGDHGRQDALDVVCSFRVINKVILIGV